MASTADAASVRRRAAASPSAGPVGQAVVTLTVVQLARLVGGVVRQELDRAAPVAAHGFACENAALFENRKVMDGGSSVTEEEPMYQKIYGPYASRGRFHVHLYFLDGKKQFKSFATEEEAEDFRRVCERRVVNDPMSASEAVKEYVAARLDLKESSRTTLRWRLEAFVRGHESCSVSVFPALTAWRALAAANSVDTLHGTKSAAKSFFAWCIKKGLLKKDPLADVEIVGRKRRGKPQLRIDEGRKFLERALTGARLAGRRDSQQDVAMVGAAVALLLGLRNGEVVGRTVRDLDDNGTVLWVPTSKTAAGVRRVEVPEVLRPHLAKLVKGRAAEAPLFPGLNKEGMRYWSAKLCTGLGLPRVTPHGLRGTHATASMRAHANPNEVAAALGHANVGVTYRHYVDAQAASDAKQEAAANTLLSKNLSKSFGQPNTPAKDGSKTAA